MGCKEKPRKKDNNSIASEQGEARQARRARERLLRGKHDQSE
jgi:hypothetical protein